MCLWFFYFGWDKSFFVMSYYYHSSWMAYLVWTVSNWLIPLPIGYYDQTQHYYKQSTKIYPRCPFPKRILNGWWQNCLTFLSLFCRFWVYSRKLLVRGKEINAGGGSWGIKRGIRNASKIEVSFYCWCNLIYYFLGNRNQSLSFSSVEAHPLVWLKKQEWSVTSTHQPSFLCPPNVFHIINQQWYFQQGKEND